MMSKKHYELVELEGSSFRFPLDVQRQENLMRGQAIAHGVSVIGEFFRGQWGKLRASFRREAVYAELRGLDDHMLQDIGLTRGDLHAVVYANRVPANSNERPDSSQVVT